MSLIAVQNVKKGGNNRMNTSPYRNKKKKLKKESVPLQWHDRATRMAKPRHCNDTRLSQIEV